MRIVSYNILDGGEGRADPIAEVLLAQRPDVVALVEADHVEVLERIARRLEMDYIRAEGNAGHAVALLSRFAITQSINHAAVRALPRCLLEATVQPPGGLEMTFGVVHFGPYAFEADETEREAEAEALLEVFAPHRQARRAHILAGDFNSNSPIQQIDPARCSLRTREAFEANGGRIPRRVVQRMLEAGYLDSLAVVEPGRAGTWTSFTTQYPGQRVDYLFTYGLADRDIKAGWIEQDRLAKYASDHFPVGVEVGH